MNSPTLALSGGPDLPIYVGSLIQVNDRMYEVTQVNRRRDSTGVRAAPFGRPVTARAAR